MQPFADIRVLDLTHVIAGPFCAYQLAALGADVIKIEPPRNPDISRQSDADATGFGADFVAQNANKRAIAVDLKTSEGVEIVRRLIKTADVFVENYRAGALAKLGLGYRSAKKINARIIYCSVTGFGQTGSLSKRTAYDNVVQAYSGLMAATGDAAAAPTKVGPPVLDYGTGMQAAFAIAAALYQRKVTGRGQYIDVAMLDSALMLMGSHITYYRRHGKLAARSGNGSDTQAGYGCYETRRGLLMIGAYTGAQYKNMWKVLGEDEYAAAPATVKTMRKNFARDAARIAKLVRAKTAAQWETELNRYRVPAARVRELDETLAGAQINSRAVLQPMPPAAELPAAWRAQSLPTAAFAYANDGPNLHRPPPKFAQHTREVLTEIGYGEPAIRELHQRGVIKIAR